MLPGMELMGCTDLAVPAEVMRHVVGVESSYNPFAIGVVGGRLARQPRTLAEALSTTRMLEREGYNFSVGLAQVNRHALASQGLDTHEQAFDACPNLRAGARILAECHRRAGGDWGRAFSCYYSGNFVTGFQHGYVQKVLASWQAGRQVDAIPVLRSATGRSTGSHARTAASSSRIARRVQEASPARIPALSTDAGRVASGVVGEAVTGAGTLRVEQPAGVDPVDRPVTVQSTAAALQRQLPAPPQSTSSSAPSGDDAFVF